MARKEINFGLATVDPTNNIAWRGILDNDMLGPGDDTDFHVVLARPAADVPFAPGAPGLDVWVIRFPAPDAVAVTPGPAVGVGTDTGNQLVAGEIKTVDFQITNVPAGGNPAGYILLAVITWDDGSGNVGFAAAPLPGGFVVP